MISISYKVGCRHCLKSDGVNHLYNYNDIDEEDYNKKKEFELMTQIEQWRIEDGHTCILCGSNNVEVLDIAVDNHPLYSENYLKLDYDNLGYLTLMFNIEKIGSDIKFKPGGHNKFDTNFLQQAVSEIAASIENRAEDFFESNNNGNFFICLNGGMNWEYERIDVHIQRLRHSGLTKSEILFAIRPFAIQIGINI